MPIPIYERQTPVAPIPGANVQNTAGQDAFGAGVWRAVGGLSDVMRAKAEEFEDAETLELFNQYRREVDKYHLDPDTGIYNTKLGKNAQGVTEAADLYMDNLASRYAGKLKSPRAVANFRKMAARVRESQSEANMRFQAKQIETYRDAEADASIETALDAIGRNYSDDVAIETYKTEIFQALELKTRGLGEKAQQAAMQAMEDRIGGARLSRMIDDDPIAAQEWFSENKDRFSAAAQAKAKDVLEKEVGKKIVRSGADSIWKEFGDDEESAREAIYADEHFTDEQKDMIWQRYQARAVDNRRFEAQAETEWYNKWYEALGKAESLEEAVDMIDRSGATGKYRLDLLAMARQTFSGRGGSEKIEDDLGAYFDAYRRIELGEITTPDRLVEEYGAALKPETIKTLGRQIISGAIQDQRAAEGGDSYVKEIMKQARIEDPNEQAIFLMIYAEEVLNAQEEKGRRLTQPEKNAIAKTLAKDVVKEKGFFSSTKTKRYREEAAERTGAKWDARLKAYVIRDEDGEIVEILAPAKKEKDADVELSGREYRQPEINRELYRAPEPKAKEKKKAEIDDLPGGSPKKKQLNERQAAFVNEIAPDVVRTAKDTGVLPSVVTAQAIHESAWGKSRIGNNLFGVKAGRGWNGTARTVGTHEYAKGKRIETKAAFRDYPSVKDSIRDHGLLLSGKRYAGVRAAKNYREAARALQNAGYATDPQYADKLIRIIETYGLDALDEA